MGGGPQHSDPHIDLGLGLGLAGVAVAGVLVYLNALGNPLLFDDQYLFGDNQRLTGADALGRLLTEPGMTSKAVFEDHFRPLLMLSFWVDLKLGDGSIAWLRAVNAAIHAGCAALVGALGYRLLRGMGREPAAARATAVIAAALFAVHPIHFEAVALILKRNSSLSTLFMLAALVALDGAFHGGGRRRARWAAAIALGGAAVFVKEDAAVLPALAGVYGVAAGLWRGRARLGWAAVGSLAVVPAVYAALWFPGGAVGADPGLGVSYLFAQPAAFASYLGGLFSPDGLVVASGLRVESLPPSWPAVAGVVGLAAALALAVIGWRRAPLAAFAVVWAAICLGPTSSVFSLRLVADFIRVYAALFGVLVAAASGLWWLGEALAERVTSAPGRRWVRLAPAIACSLAAGLATLAVNARHGDELVVWAHATERFPDGAIPNANLCATLAKRSMYREAASQCGRAETLDPSNPYVVQSRVTALGSLGAIEDAQAAVAAAIARMGRRWQLALVEGHLAWFRDDLERAASAYEHALRGDPGNPEASVYLADALSRLGRDEAAAAILAPLAGRPLGDELAPLYAATRARLPAP